jgi:Large polyvalent protein associated domain 39
VATIAELRAGLGSEADSYTDEQLYNAYKTVAGPRYRDEKSFNQAVGWDPEWDFGRGMRIAGRGSLAAGAGAGAALADTFGLTGARDAALSYGRDQQKQAFQLGRRSDDVDNFTSDPLSFLSSAAGQGVAYAAPSLLGGGVGALGARALGARALAGYAAGAGAVNLGQETGGIYNELAEQGRYEPGRALAFGLPAAALDTASELIPGLGKTIAGGVTRRVGLGALRQAGVEAGTETAQTAIERAGAYKDVAGPEAWHEYRNAAAVGAVGGGMFGGAMGLLPQRRPTTPGSDKPPVNDAPGQPTDLLNPTPSGPTEPAQLGWNGRFETPMFVMPNGQAVTREQFESFDPVVQNYLNSQGAFRPEENMYAAARAAGTPAAASPGAIEQAVGLRPPMDRAAREQDLRAAFEAPSGVNVAEPDQWLERSLPEGDLNAIRTGDAEMLQVQVKQAQERHAANRAAAIEGLVDRDPTGKPAVPVNPREIETFTALREMQAAGTLDAAGFADRVGRMRDALVNNDNKALNAVSKEVKAIKEQANAAGAGTDGRTGTADMGGGAGNQRAPGQRGDVQPAPVQPATQGVAGAGTAQLGPRGSGGGAALNGAQITERIQQLDPVEQAYVGRWLGVDLDEDGNMTVRESGAESLRAMARTLGVSHESVRERVKAALDKLGLPAGMGPKQLYDQLGLVAARTDLDTLERNVNADTPADEDGTGDLDAVSETEDTGALGGVGDTEVRVSQAARRANDLVPEAPDTDPAGRVREAAGPIDEGSITAEERLDEARALTLDTALEGDFAAGRVSADDVVEAEYFYGQNRQRGMQPWGRLDVPTRAEFVRVYARARLAGDPAVLATKKALYEDEQRNDGRGGSAADAGAARGAASGPADGGNTATGQGGTGAEQGGPAVQAPRGPAPTVTVKRKRQLVKPEPDVRWGDQAAQMSRDTERDGEATYHTAESLEDSLLSFMNEDVLGKRVIIVDTGEDLKHEGDRWLASYDNTAVAWARDGRAYLIADRIPVGKERGVFLHEVGGHLGLERLLGDKEYSRLVGKLVGWAARNDDSQESTLARKAKERVDQAGTEGAEARNAELVAYFLEEAVNAGINPTALRYDTPVRQWLRTLWAAFKVGLRRLGVSIDKLTAQDVVNLGYGAARITITGRFHGTAADVQQFRTKYIGTGEGAQAYGWGLYFSELRGVAEDYKKSDVKRKSGGMVGGNKDASQFPMWDELKDLATGEDYLGFDTLGEMLRGYLQDHRAGRDQEFLDSYDISEDLRSTLVDFGRWWFKPAQQVQGNLYATDIAVKPDEFLDWTKPLDEQSDTVRNATSKILAGTRRAGETADELRRIANERFSEEDQPLARYISLTWRKYAQVGKPKSLAQIAQEYTGSKSNVDAIARQMKAAIDSWFDSPQLPAEYEQTGGGLYRYLEQMAEEGQGPFEPDFALDDYLGELGDKYNAYEVNGNTRTLRLRDSMLTPEEKAKLDKLQADSRAARELEGKSAAERVSRYLDSIGIKGVRMPVNYTRGGTYDEGRNFVVFNEKNVIKALDNPASRVSKSVQFSKADMPDLAALIVDFRQAGAREVAKFLARADVRELLGKMGRHAAITDPGRYSEFWRDEMTGGDPGVKLPGDYNFGRVQMVQALGPRDIYKFKISAELAEDLEAVDLAMNNAYREFMETRDMPPDPKQPDADGLPIWHEERMKDPRYAREYAKFERQIATYNAAVRAAHIEFARQYGLTPGEYTDSAIEFRNPPPFEPLYDGDVDPDARDRDPATQAENRLWALLNSVVGARVAMAREKSAASVNRLVNKVSKGVQFSKAVKPEAAAQLAAAHAAVTENLPQPAKDAWTSVRDFFKKNTPYLLTNFQLAEQFGAKIKSLKAYVKVADLMRMETMKQQMEFDAIATRWDSLPKAARAMLDEITQRATLREMHPDLPFDHKDNGHLKDREGAKAEHAALAAKYKQMANAHPAAAKVYQDAKAVLEASRQRMVDASNKLYADYGIKKTVPNEMAGPYFPLMRFGEYLAIGESAAYKALADEVAQAPPGDARKELDKRLDTMKRDPKHYIVSAHESRSAMERARDQYAKQGLEARVAMADQRLDALPKDVHKMVSQLATQMANKFDGATATAFIDEYKALLVKALPELHALNRAAERKGVEGASPDMLRAFAAAGRQNAFYTARLMHAKDSAQAMQDMKGEVKGNTDLQHVHREIEKRAALDLQFKDTPLQDLAGTASWVYYLGASPTFLFMNMTQPWLVTGPVLAGQYGAAKATKALGKASREALQVLRDARWKDGKWSPWEGISESSVSTTRKNAEGVSEDRKALRELMQRGIVDEGLQHELRTFAEGGNRTLAKFGRWTGWASQQIELVNRTATALATFRLAREQGMDYDAAVNEAYRVTTNTQMDYSAEGTARFMREGGGIPLAKLLFQFRRYQQTMLYVLGDNIKKLANPAEREVAAKSLAYFAMTSGLAAGAMGLPFAGTMMMLANAFMDDDDERGDARTRLRNLLFDLTGDRGMADVLAKGIPAAFGADLSARIGLGDIAQLYPRLELNGKTGEENVGKMAASVLGPSAGLATQFFQAGIHFSNGDFAKGTEKMVPKMLADVLRAGRYSTQGMTDGKGETILGPEEISAWDKLLRAAGTTSTNEANYYEGENAKRRIETAVNDRKSQIHREFNRAIRSGDFEDVRAMIDEFNEDHPEARIKPKDEIAWRRDLRKAESQRDDTGIKFNPKRDQARAEVMRFARE